MGGCDGKIAAAPLRGDSAGAILPTREPGAVHCSAIVTAIVPALIFAACRTNSAIVSKAVREAAVFLLIFTMERGWSAPHSGGTVVIDIISKNECFVSLTTSAG